MVRDIPDAKGESVGSLPRGTRATVYAYSPDGGFYYVAAGNVHGWINDMMARPADSPDPRTVADDDPDGGRWIWYTQTENSERFFYTGIVRNGDLAEVWDRSINPKTGLMTAYHVRVDCKARKSLLLQQIDYDADGVVTGSEDHSDKPIEATVVPGTGGAALFGAVCRKK